MTLPYLNYLAVLVAGIVIFVLGGLWFSPVLFARKWVSLMGKSEEEMKAGSGAMPILLLQAFLCGLAVAFTMAIVIHHYTNLTLLRAAMVGAVCWLGFAGATSYSTAIFSMQSKQLWLINSGYNLVSFVIAALILAVWR